MDPKDAQAAAIIARLHLVTQITCALIASPKFSPVDPCITTVARAEEFADKILERNPLPV